MGYFDSYRVVLMTTLILSSNMSKLMMYAWVAVLLLDSIVSISEKLLEKK